MGASSLLYLSTNDGSDTRINKEIFSLSKKHSVIFIGIRSEHSATNFLSSVAECRFVIGNRKSLTVYCRYFFMVLRIFLSGRVKYVHIINEQLLFIFYPVLFFVKNVTVDLFDSWFLKNDMTGYFSRALQIALFFPVEKLIVTDHDRFLLLPARLQERTAVIENYPYYFSETKLSRASRELTIAYYGSLQASRGTNLLNHLLNTSDMIRVLSAGWIYDEMTRELIFGNSRVEYFGVLDQKTVNRHVFEKADFILCLYEPNNRNNIYASPNKIYDAIQLETPVIINSEIKASSFVTKHNLGLCIDSYYTTHYQEVVNQLLGFNFKEAFNREDKREFCWESIEGKLLSIHG